MNTIKEILFYAIRTEKEDNVEHVIWIIKKDTGKKKETLN